MNRNVIPVKVRLCPQQGVLWGGAVWVANTSTLTFKVMHDVPSNHSFLITIPAAAAIQYAGPGMLHNTTMLTIETDDPLGPVLPIPFMKSPALYPEGNFTQAKVSFVPARSEAGNDRFDARVRQKAALAT